jgi:hypothetical protein
MSEKRNSAELRKQLIEVTRLRDELEDLGIKGIVLEAMDKASVLIDECRKILKAQERDLRKASKTK